MTQNIALEGINMISLFILFFAHSKLIFNNFYFSENSTLNKQLTDERSKMQSKILTLEEANTKLQKENKNKKLASQQTKG